MVRRCVLFVVLALVLGSGVGLAQGNNCTIVGTWMHSSGPADIFTWTLVVTPGPTPRWANLSTNGSSSVQDSAACSRRRFVPRIRTASGRR